MLAALKLRLVDDWHQAWKWSSMRFIALGVVAQGAVMGCPDKLAQYIPGWFMSGLSMFALLCGLLAAAGRITTTESKP